MKQDIRRGWRTVVWAATRLTLLVLLWVLIDWLARGSPRSDLAYLAYGLIVLIGIGELFYGSENVAARINLHGPGGLGLDFDSSGPDSRVTPDDPDGEPT